MKAILISLFLTCTVHYGIAQHDLRLEIGLAEPIGQVRITVYHTSECFLQKGGAFLAVWVPADSSCVEHTFRNLSTGHYAVSIFLDKNKNGKIDRNILGIPSEPYGFSRNVRPRLRPPRFEEVAVLLDKDVSLEILLLQ